MEIVKIKNIFSFDDYLKIRNHLNKPNWSYGHKSFPQSIKYFWKMELGDNKFFTDYLFEIIKKNIGEYKLEAVYANGQTYGLDGDFHYDCSPSDNTRYTFLYYCNEEWDANFFGCTVFKYPDNNVKYFYPEPNSAILFPGNILHCGQAPSREYCGLRMTIAYKLKKL